MGILALAGGNEFRDNCVQMDQHLLTLLPKTASAPQVVIIPTAAVRGSPQMAAQNGVRYFKNLGAEASAAMVLTQNDANMPSLFQNITTADMVYLAGGDPGYLLEVLQDSALLKAMKVLYQRGGIVAGSSAGAMVLSTRMRVWNKGDWISGLGMAAKVAVLVHHATADRAVIDFLARTPDFGFSIIGIPEATACYSLNAEAQSSSWQVAGDGSVTVYQNGTATAYKPEERFTI